MWIVYISHLFQLAAQLSRNTKIFTFHFPIYKIMDTEIFSAPKRDMDETVRTDMRSPFLTVVAAKLTPAIPTSCGYT
jgi:hypothetical protein